MNRNKVSEYQKKILEGQDNYAKLLHRVFKQTDAGKELLEHWEHLLKMTPGNDQGSDLYSLGLIEGRKAFVREIILFSKQAEGA